MSDVDTTLRAALAIDGAVAVALVDHGTGASLGQAGDPGTDLAAVAAEGTDVVRAGLRAVQRLGGRDHVEDVLITLGARVHLLRLLRPESGRGLFLHLVLEKEHSNLALARRQLTLLERALVL